MPSGVQLGNSLNLANYWQNEQAGPSLGKAKGDPGLEMSLAPCVIDAYKLCHKSLFGNSRKETFMCMEEMAMHPGSISWQHPTEGCCVCRAGKCIPFETKQPRFRQRVYKHFLIFLRSESAQQWGNVALHMQLYPYHNKAVIFKTFFSIEKHLICWSEKEKNAEGR